MCDRVIKLCDINHHSFKKKVSQFIDESLKKFQYLSNLSKLRFDIKN